MPGCSSFLFWLSGISYSGWLPVCQVYFEALPLAAAFPFSHGLFALSSSCLSLPSYAVLGAGSGLADGRKIDLDLVTFDGCTFVLSSNVVLALGLESVSHLNWEASLFSLPSFSSFSSYPASAYFRLFFKISISLHLLLGKSSSLLF